MNQILISNRILNWNEKTFALISNTYLHHTLIKLKAIFNYRSPKKSCTALILLCFSLQLVKWNQRQNKTNGDFSTLVLSQLTRNILHLFFLNIYYRADVFLSYSSWRWFLHATNFFLKGIENNWLKYFGVDELFPAGNNK